jgi:hypothetical protein
LLTEATIHVVSLYISNQLRVIFLTNSKRSDSHRRRHPVRSSFDTRSRDYWKFISKTNMMEHLQYKTKKRILVDVNFFLHSCAT